MKINGCKFMYDEVLHQVKIVDGSLIIANADGYVFPESDLTGALKKEAVRALAAKPEFELITVCEREISRELFVTKELAHATMLAQLKFEFDGSYDEDDWEDVLETLSEDGKVSGIDFGINENSAWSNLGDNIDWQILSLKDESPIVNAEFTSVWDGGTCVTTPCKVNLRTKQVFAIMESPNTADSVNELDVEYISFCGMDANVYEKEDLDPEYLEYEYWYE